MSSTYLVCRIIGTLLLVLLVCTSCNAAHADAPATLRVCADPNNLPFSNDRGEGFENRIAELVAKDLGKHVAYTWFPQRRGFLKNTLKANKCDVVIGVPADYDMVAPTRPYYRSTYVFVTKPGLVIASLDDKQLAKLRIGIHAIGDDYANSPAAEALARRGFIDHIVGYSIYGDYSKPDPAQDLVGAVASGDVDVAIVWGPLAGHAAHEHHLAVTPVTPALDPPALAFQFAIAMGVRKGDKALHDALDHAIAHEQKAIAKVLDAYGVPRLPLEKEAP
jgi:mxaJ protein